MRGWGEQEQEHVQEHKRLGLAGRAPDSCSGAKRLRRWGSVRLRLTLWNVAVLALILGALGGVVRYTVQADLFATVDRILAERAHPAVMLISTTSAPHSQRVLRRRAPRLSGLSAGNRQFWIGVPSSGGRIPARRQAPSVSVPDMPSAVVAVGAWAPGGTAALLPRVIFRDPPQGFDRGPWDRRSLIRSFAGQELYSTVRAHGEPVRVLSLPVERQGHIDQVLQLAYPLAGVYRELDGLTRTLLMLVPVGLLVAGLGGALLTGHALRPVVDFAAAAARLGAHNLSGRLSVGGQDEFSELAVSFNALLARLEEAFDRQRRFTADASHELRTPLSIIKANTNVALEHPWPADRYRELIAAIDAAANRQARLVEELLFLARADAGGLARDVGPVCLLEVMEEAAEAVEGPRQPCVRIEGAGPELMVPGSGSELTRLFTNLLQNAVRHTAPQGKVTVAAAADAQRVIVTVADTGEGIPPEHLPFLGERFYRVDAARSAAESRSGLGLAICRSIVQAHGGRMTIESEVGQGTTVSIALPFQPSQRHL